MASQAGLLSAPRADPTSALALMWSQISPVWKFGGEQGTCCTVLSLP